MNLSRRHLALSVAAFAALGAIVAVSTLLRPGWREVEPAPQPTTPNVRLPTADRVDDSIHVESGIQFSLVPTTESGVDFEYYGAPSDEHYMTEQNGGGVALFDADSDGALDFFLANGSNFARPADESAGSRLYRQSAAWRFTDVTREIRIQSIGFGQGCAAGDYNNDGFCDLFVAAFGANGLWRNNGDGTFSDVTEEAELGDPKWASSAAFADLDADGNLELYVVNYVDWRPGDGAQGRIPSPMHYDGVTDQLYKNFGDGRFEEIGADAGIALAPEGKGLALAITDLDGDFQPDIFVANDTTRNFLFQNLGDLRFREVGVLQGCATSEDGKFGSSMGVSVSDYNRDGRLDLFVTNFAHEVVDVLTNLGPQGFIANNAELGIDASSREMLNFGIVASDFDADQWPDLFFANGHLWDSSSVGGQYRMPPSLLKNVEGRRFIDVTDSAGDYFRKSWLGRAVVVGDVDNDLDVDLIVSHLLDPPALLRNDSERGGNSLQLKLIGSHAPRQPLGVRVEVIVNGELIVTRVPAGESFQANHDDRVLISIGPAMTADEVRVYWSAGDIEVWFDVKADQLRYLRQGTGSG